MGKKNKLAKLALNTLACSLLLVGVERDSQYIKPQREIIQIDQLVINRNDNIRTIVHKSLEEGLEDIKFLSSHSAYEEEWIFIPKSNLWIEIGLQSKVIPCENSAKSTASAKNSEVHKLINGYKNVIDIHIHPDFDILFAEASKLKKQQSNIDKYKIAVSNISNQEPALNLSKTMIYLRNQFSAYPGQQPSTADINTALERSSYTSNKEQNEPYKNIEFVIGSTEGITTYRITSHGLKAYKDKREEEFYSTIFSKKTDSEITIQNKCFSIHFKKYDFEKTQNSEKKSVYLDDYLLLNK